MMTSNEEAELLGAVRDWGSGMGGDGSSPKGPFEISGGRTLLPRDARCGHVVPPHKAPKGQRAEPGGSPHNPPLFK
jgi:hypothetical protein